MQSETRSVVEEERLMEKTVMDNLQSEKDLSQHTPSIPSQPYPPIDPLHVRLDLEAHAVEEIETTQRLRLTPKLEREDTATQQIVIPHLHIPQAQSTDPDPESGLKIETSADDVGKAVRNSVEESVTRKVMAIDVINAVEAQKALDLRRNVAPRLQKPNQTGQVVVHTETERTLLLKRRKDVPDKNPVGDHLLVSEV